MTFFYAIAFYCVQHQTDISQSGCHVETQKISGMDACETSKADAYLMISRIINGAGLEMPVFEFRCEKVLIGDVDA